MFNRKIIGVQSDWGGEYEKLNFFFTKIGITHQVSCPFFEYLSAHVGLIFAPTTKESLNFDSRNMLFLGIVICIKVSSAFTFLPVGFIYQETSFFYENIFPFSKLHSHADARLQSEILLLPSSLHSVDNMDVPCANYPNHNNAEPSVVDGVRIAVSPDVEINSDSAPKGAGAMAVLFPTCSST
jgi:hypothetical protein